MAHYRATTGFEDMTGAISKRKVQGVNELSITRRKHYRDPLTGEVVALGPKEIFIRKNRDYDRTPLTPGEQHQHAAWSDACRKALEIIRDKTDPRYMEFYSLWRAQLNSPNGYKDFHAYIRTTIYRTLYRPLA